MNRKIKAFREVDYVARELIKDAEKTKHGEFEYINFLSYCSEHLDTCDSIQVIFRDFQDSTA